MARTISNRPDTEHEMTIGSHLEAKAGSRREFGRLLDQMNTKTKKPRKRRRRGVADGRDEIADDELLELRDVWLSRLMFNEFIGWPPETRSFNEYVACHTGNSVASKESPS